MTCEQKLESRVRQRNWAGQIMNCDKIHTVSIQEGEDFSLSLAGSKKPRRDQALPLRLTHYLHNLQ